VAAQANRDAARLQHGGIVARRVSPAWLKGARRAALAPQLVRNPFRSHRRTGAANCGGVLSRQPGEAPSRGLALCHAVARAVKF
jgi:hypothetical protein